ncbi:MAG: glutamate synthase large subunit [Pseudomonadota bacterium]
MSTRWQQDAAHLAQHGLYSPADEHDACGVGLIAAIDGVPRRDIVERGIEGLRNMWHRGAVDADGKTGDGAGIHIQLPQTFFADYIARIGKQPDARLAVGMVFLPKKNFAAQELCRAIIETEILRLNYSIHGWRQVPVVSDVIGDIANDSRPEIEQVIIAGRPEYDEARIERDLYLIRRRIENAVRAHAIHGFYICSLSSRSIIYKGLFKAEQLTSFYPDLLDERFISNFAVFHQRFSTNTAPAWHLAQPFRVLAHNGEINTLRGNVNFMRSHEATFSSDAFAGLEQDLIPVIPEHTSDTGALDAVMEILTRAGRALPLAKLILIPPAWSKNKELPEHHRHLFACCNAISEQWDGPAAIAATDGEWVIAGMDRHGLRPMRYLVTRDGLLICASESGMVEVAEEDVLERGRLGPGEMIGVNLLQQTLYRDHALKDHLAAQQPYGEWVSKTVLLRDILASAPKNAAAHVAAETLLQRQLAVGLTMEQVETIIHPMAATGKEAIGSMGDDTPIAVLSHEARPFHHYFRQNFSQVTNPPIDSLRERRVMSLKTRFGNDGNFLALDNSHSEILLADTPVLLGHELDAIASHFATRVTRIDTLFTIGAPDALRDGLERIVREAEHATLAGKSYILLSDDGVDNTHAAIPMILAISAVHSHLVKKKLRKKASILVRTAECYDVHALAVMIGSGATVVHPSLAEAIALNRHHRGLLGDTSREDALENLREAMSQGLLKIMSKMGISVVSAYRGGLNFEAIGLSRALAAEFFPGLPSRISGIGLSGLQARICRLHATAYPAHAANVTALPIGGFYRLRAGSETHAWSGENIHALQSAVGSGSYMAYKTYAASVNARPPVYLRDLLDFRYPTQAIALEEVEPVTAIRKRFVAPAMSLGALSPEAHETLAIAMNRIGAASNSGEGGEGAERYQPRANGDNANSVIKQVASGRFGVTAEYLNSAREIQIKVAQGAKPGEGGQLPGFKVTAEIARLRHATEGVMLISPPPHHDIYSIEDLAQLIYDLKQINPGAIVSVKLVAQAGIGTIASGVAKAMADKIIIAGHSGGTGASALSSVKHAGVPWELGLAEANQVLTLNRLRHRVTLQTDGGLKTGRDIVIAAILGAEEYALGTAALVAMGCLMVRQCHSNTCPVGITTQDEMLRSKFTGTVDKVVNLMSFVAEEVREILASLGARSLNEVIGHTELLQQVNRGTEEMVDLDLNTVLTKADAGPHARYCTMEGRNEVAPTLDEDMLDAAAEALTKGEKIQLAYSVRNTMRAIGTRLSSLVVTHGGVQHADQITLRLRGSAGQSLGAFLTRGIRIELYGDANDYVGKGLSGGTIMLRPRPSSSLLPQDNTILGNTVLYGATAGLLLANGQAGERFAVRNSGADAVVEGCGSNGCEYMTGGSVVILGEVGQNFGAGMTGGMAYVYDPNSSFSARLNGETVIAQRLASRHWEAQLYALLREHYRQTQSPLAETILAAWDAEKQHFWQVCPKEMIARIAQPLSDDAARARSAG